MNFLRRLKQIFLIPISSPEDYDAPLILSLLIYCIFHLNTIYSNCYNTLMFFFLHYNTVLKVFEKMKALLKNTLLELSE